MVSFEASTLIKKGQILTRRSHIKGKASHKIVSDGMPPSLRFSEQSV
jgi:hypothetical protein